MTDADMDEVREWVMDTVRQNTEPIPEGQNIQSPLWTSHRRLASGGERWSTPHSRDMVERATNALISRGRLFSWHGQVCPTDPDHLRAVIEAERNADVTRQILIGKANRVIQEQNGDEGGEDGDGDD